MDYVLKLTLVIILKVVGVTDNCGCNSPRQERFEFPIQDITSISNINLHIDEDIFDPEELCKLKNKVICEFLDILNKLECGIQPDLEFLLQEISLIYIYDE